MIRSFPSRSTGLSVSPLAALLLMAAAARGGTIEGVARMAVTGEPVAGAEITAAFAGTEHKTVSGTSGEFRLPDLPPGTYRVRGRKDGVHPSKHEPGRVSIAGERDRAEVTVRFVRPVSLRGRVMDENRKPVAGIHVMLEPSYTSGAIAAATDQRGAYEFAGIEPGEYGLVARPAKIAFGTGFVHWDSSGVTPPEAIDGQARAWIAESYPGRIAAQPGAEISGLDIHLRSTLVFPYAGRVKDPRGDPAEARILVIGSGNAFPEHSVETDAKGTFRIPALAEGEWTFAATHVSGSAAGAAFDRVLVTGPRRKPLDLRLELPFSVEARAELPPNHRATSRRFALVLRPLTASPEFRVRLTAGLDGRMEPRNVHRGRYLVLAESATGAYAESVKLGGQEVLGQPVDLQPGGPRFEVTFREGKSRISGRVEKGEGVTVIAIPSDPMLARIRGLRIAECGAGGRFSIEAMAPGSYRLLAFDVFPAGLAPGFEERLPPGQTVTVNQGESKSTDLSVSPWPLPLY